MSRTWSSAIITITIPLTISIELILFIYYLCAVGGVYKIGEVLKGKVNKKLSIFICLRL